MPVLSENISNRLCIDDQAYDLEEFLSPRECIFYGTVLYFMHLNLIGSYFTLNEETVVECHTNRLIQRIFN